MIAVNLHLDTVDRFLESWLDENFKIIAEKEMSNGHATHCPGQERSVVWSETYLFWMNISIERIAHTEINMQGKLIFLKWEIAWKDINQFAMFQVSSSSISLPWGL